MVLFYVGVAYIPLFITGGILNSYVLYSLLKFKKTNNNLQFGNLERLLLALNASDLITCLVSIPVKITLYMIIETQNSQMQQKFSYIVDLFCQFSSVLIVTMIAINNCVKITRFSSYNRIMTTSRVTNFIRTAFVISGLIVLVPILISPALLLIVLLLVILIALAIMIYSYVIIVKELRATEERLRNETTNEGKTKVKRENKVSRTVLILLSCFFVCTIVPRIVASICYFFFDLEVFKISMLFIAFVFNLNSISNPCIYVLRNGKYGITLFRRKRATVANKNDNNNDTSNPKGKDSKAATLSKSSPTRDTNEHQDQEPTFSGYGESSMADIDSDPPNDSLPKNADEVINETGTLTPPVYRIEVLKKES